MIDNLLGDADEEAETADEVDDEELGGLFDDPGDGAAGDDLMGGGDDPEDDDLMGGGDDGSSLEGSGGAANTETQKRVDEIEDEVDSLSSSVNTVRSENEKLSESLDDVEENIRKLLEIYDMVTRGVNPFVDEEEMGGGLGGTGDGGGGSMGLFGGDEQPAAESTSEIDDSVVEADAAEFFEEDLDETYEEETAFDDEPEEGSGEAAAEDSTAAEDTVDDDTVDDTVDERIPGENSPDDGDPDDLDDASGGGKSFEDLKSEYESADADGGGGDVNGDVVGDSGGDPTSGAPDVTDGADSKADGGPASGGSSRGEKPYLQELPGGYLVDVVVMDWLEFLVEESGVDGAAGTIAYYEAIDWVSESAAESLRTYLEGFGDGVETDPAPQSWLTVSHHNTSLRYISRIDDPSMEVMAFEERGNAIRPDGRTRRDSRGVPRPPSANGGPESGGVSESRGLELESDGGRRTSVDRGETTYEPAVSRRHRGTDSDERDAEVATDDAGYGGFQWHGERQ